MSDHTIFTPHQIAVAPGEGLVIAAAEEDGEDLCLHVTNLRAAVELLDCAASLHATMLDAAADRIAVRPVAHQREPERLLCTDENGVVTQKSAEWRSLRKENTPAPPVLPEPERWHVVEFVGEADAAALGWTVPGARLAFVVGP